MQPFLSRTKKPFLFWSLISLAVIVAVGGVLATWKLAQPCLDNDQKRVWGTCYRDLQARPLTIGVAIGAPDEDYNPLAAYLRDQLGIQVEVNRDTPYEQLANRMVRKDWDIAFTRSPIFSILAEDSRYTGVAVMFPDQPPYYRAALYVRSDSPIQSIADMKSTTTLALGNPESAQTFHMPIYALYGKSLRVGTGHRPREVVKMVKVGKVDVGAGRFDTVKDDPALRIIYVGKAIPGAGVYLSPLLSSTDRELVREALLNAPPEVREQAKYGDGRLPKYDELRKIMSRTEKILECPDLNTNSFDLRTTVNLFCRDPNVIAGQFRLDLVGQVTEYKLPSQGNVEFKVVTEAGQIYLVLVPRPILSQAAITPARAIDKSVQLNAVEARKLADGTWKVQITQPDQLSLLK